MFVADLIKAWTAAEVTDGDAAMTTKGWKQNKYILKHLYYQYLSNTCTCITISILDLWRFHIGSNVLLIWIFSIKNFLYNFFSRLVDITRVLSLIVIKPLSEDNPIYVNSLTFIFNHGFDFPLLYKVTIRRQSVLCEPCYIFSNHEWMNKVMGL